MSKHESKEKDLNSPASIKSKIITDINNNNTPKNTPKNHPTETPVELQTPYDSFKGTIWNSYFGLATVISLKYVYLVFVGLPGDKETTGVSPFFNNRNGHTN